MTPHRGDDGIEISLATHVVARPEEGEQGDAYARDRRIGRLHTEETAGCGVLAVAVPAEERPRQEELVEGVLAVEGMAAGEAVRLFQVEGRQHLAAQHPARLARRVGRSTRSPTSSRRARRPPSFIEGPLQAVHRIADVDAAGQQARGVLSARTSAHHGQ